MLTTTNTNLMKRMAAFLRRQRLHGPSFFDVCTDFIMVESVSTRGLHVIADIFAHRPPKHALVPTFRSPCYSEDDGCSGGAPKAWNIDFHRRNSRNRRHDGFFFVNAIFSENVIFSKIFYFQKTRQ